MMLGTGRFLEINKIVGGIAILMIMFYLGPGDETTFEMLIGDL